MHGWSSGLRTTRTAFQALVTVKGVALCRLWGATVLFVFATELHNMAQIHVNSENCNPYKYYSFFYADFFMDFAGLHWMWLFFCRVLCAKFHMKYYVVETTRNQICMTHGQYNQKRTWQRIFSKFCTASLHYTNIYTRSLNTDSRTDLSDPYSAEINHLQNDSVEHNTSSSSDLNIA